MRRAPLDPELGPPGRRVGLSPLPERSGESTGKRLGGVLSLARKALESRGAAGPSLALVVLAGVLGYSQGAGNVLPVLLLLGVVLFEFQKRIDQGLPLMQMAAMMGVLQWTVGPLLSYRTSLVEGRYAMYTDEANYFSFALPGAAAYVLGLLGFGSSVRQRELLQGVKREHFMTIGLALNAVALVARVLAPRLPGGLSFAGHLLSQVGYVGVLYFLFSPHPYRWRWIALCLLPLFKSTGESAMFHDIILWLGLIFCFWYGMKPHTVGAKMGLLVVGVLAIFTIQGIKADYRSKVWKGEEASLTEEAMDFWTSSNPFESDEVLANVIMRLNQGWIISSVLTNVPALEPYAEGETLVDAVTATLVPRFLMPDKATSGGQKNFRRFTGLRLEEGTSMAVSPLGEAYANFGREGGIVLMLVFGLAFASFYAFCLRYTLKDASFLFWVPLIFYQAIKAETEFVTVLNQISKGAVVAFALHWVITKKWMPILIKKQEQKERRGLGRGARQADEEPGSEGSGLLGAKVEEARGAALEGRA